MRKGLTAASFLVFIAFLLAYPTYSVAEKANPAGTTKKVTKKYRVSKNKSKGAKSLKSAAARSEQVVAVDGETRKAKSARTRAAKKKSRKAIAAAVTEQPVVSEQADNSEYFEYKVRRGDTLDKLAQKFNIDKEELIDLNNIKKHRLTPGALVFIPKMEEDGEPAPVELSQHALKPWKNEEERGILVKVAKSFSGAPYRFGGDTVRGLDCSAFVKKMYEIFEVQLPRSAREQYYAGPKVGKEELCTGDLVFFKTKRFAKYPTHVGIYIGENKFIHASSQYSRGVKVDSLTENYFNRTYMGAVRIKAPPVEKTDTGAHAQQTANNT